jgi:hypothetical protein
MISVGRSLKVEPGRVGISSDKNRRSDSGEMERVRLLFDDAALALRTPGTGTAGETDQLGLSGERPRSSSRFLLLKRRLQAGPTMD